MFYAAGKRWLYFRLLKGIDPAELADGFLLRVEETDDFCTVARAVEVPLRRNADFADLRARLEAAGFAPAQRRFLSFGDGRVAVCHSRDWIYETYRYVVAPEAAPTGPGEVEVFAAVAEVSAIDYLDVVGLFAPVVVAPEETLAQIKPRIAGALALDGAALARAKVFHGARWVLFSPAAALKDDEGVGSMCAGDTLLVVLNPKRRAARGRQAEEVVKIEN
jgi:hypothetical protein